VRACATRPPVVDFLASSGQVERIEMHRAHREGATDVGVRILPRYGMSLPQAIAGAVGLFAISLGVAGLLHAGSVQPFFGVTRHELLGLDLNPAHNVLHVIVGVAGLRVMRSLPATRAFGAVLYFFFGLQLLAGMVTIYFPEWNFLGVDQADNVMHVLLMLVGAAIAWGPRSLSDRRLRRG